MGTGANVPLLPVLLLILIRVPTSINDARQHVSKCFNVLQYASMLENMVAINVAVVVLFVLVLFSDSSKRENTTHCRGSQRPTTLQRPTVFRGSRRLWSHLARRPWGYDAG